LEGNHFEIPYDRLLIATGSAAVMPDLAGFEAPGVMVVKSLEVGNRHHGKRN
jgi:NAD(P)H-nitrite reductase large subunit